MSGDGGSTSPMPRTARVRLDAKTGNFETSKYTVEVLTGAEKGRRFTVDGTAFVGSHPDCDIALTEASVSRHHAELQVTPEGLRVRDVGSTNGTRLGGAKIDSALIEFEGELALGQARIRVKLERESPTTAPLGPTQFGTAVAESASMRRLFGVLQRVAMSDASVVLLGETGTGKEVLARAIHAASSRAAGPFVVFDCGAVKSETVESELFGHVKGAFTGAIASRDGALKLADGGTFFLDELGELPPEVQPKLLRALAQGTFTPVGDSETKRTDVRVISATHQDLDELVRRGAFRSDLYFRLAVVVATVPALRERLEDLPALVRRFASEFGTPAFEPGASLLAKLASHPWPGNVRELKNAVERALLGLETEDADRAPDRAAGTAVPFKEAKDRIVDAFTREYIAGLLKEHGGNISAVARASQLNRNYVRRLMVKFGLEGKE